jgi:serine/threonine protein kinase/tetratricopeptide (TPR) repeat protein
MQGERWKALSPLLDDLLELEGRERQQRLAMIQATDPGLASDLSKLMALEDERPDFLSEPVVSGEVGMQAGDEIGPYRLVSPLGEGGMGQVWLAVRADGLYERRVAIKLLRPGLGDMGLHARFTRERQILARLGHAHIARLLDAGISADGQPFLALDYVRGEPITDYAQKLNLDVRTRLQLFLQVCAAVSHAHANLVVHRDLKPSNILVTSAGEVCLLDFGIAKLLDQPQTPSGEITRTGARAFTLHYAAPEQLRGEVITTMTDVYALGMVLYELLTDCKPYELERSTDAAWEEAILEEEPARPSLVATRKARESESISDRRRARQLAGDLDNIILKTLSKLPEQRYASVEALAQDLRRHLDGQPVLARAQSLGYRARKYLRRHAVGLGLGVGVTTVLAVALAIVSWQASRAMKEASRAQAMQDFVIALFENSGNASSTRGVDVRALLDAGVSRADTELASQPQARAELLGLIARLRSGLGDDSEALALLDRQAQLLQPLGAQAPSSLRLDAAALRGYSLRMLGRERDCLSALEPMLPVAQAAESTAALPAAEFLSQLGRCHAALDASVPVARDLFASALQLRRASGDAGALVAESETDLAELAAPEERLPALRKALAQLRASGGEQNALGVEIWQHLGDTYEELHNSLEAEAAYRQSLDIALARFGANHPRTSAAQQELASVLLGTGKLTEAERLLGLAQDSLLARWGPDSPQLAEQEGMRGMVALERDEPAESERLLTDSVRIWRARSDLDAHAADLCHLAQAQNELGRNAQADGNRHECLDLLRGNAHPDPASAVAALVHAAHAALDRKDLVEARSWLAQLPVPQPDTPAVRLLLARIAQLQGDASATDQLEKLVVGLPADRSSRRLRWQAQSLLAAQACLDGRMDEGRRLRALTLDEVGKTEPEHARQRRRLGFLSSACASGAQALVKQGAPTFP